MPLQIPKKLLTLDDHAVLGLLLRQDIMALLPCLSEPKQSIANIAPGGDNCEACQRRKVAIKAAAALSAKQCVLGAGTEKIRQLKQILDVETLVVVTQNAHNQYFKTTL